MEVTDPEEIKAIEAIRAEKIAQAARKKMMLYILEHAFLYEKWLQENGMESSYSTFRDGYGYEYCPLESVTAREVYDRVISVRSMARVPDKVTISN